ncbi:hypothetical protein MKX01_011982 [Papaver californicum]|nr:hypothetical protein MKX01_011982 [Papaver californicum]
MGKMKIEMKKIHDRKKRNVTFTKRRQGLFKKADELCRLTGADISLIVFSPNGKPYTFGCPNSNEVLHRFPVQEEEEEDDEKRRDRPENGDGFWWDDTNMEELDTLEKVDAVRDQLLQVTNLVIKRKEELLALSTSSAVPKETTTENMEDSCMFSDSWFPSITSNDDMNELFKNLDVDQKMQLSPPLIY